MVEEAARYFESFYLQMQVYKIDRESQEEKLAESYDIDMSQLLYNNKKDS
jgi:hypothetical protein